MGLQKTDRATEVGGLLSIAHVAHLVGDGFEPGLVRFTQRDHAGESGFRQYKW